MPLSKSGVGKHRGFESHPLRQLGRHGRAIRALAAPPPRSRTSKSAREACSPPPSAVTTPDALDKPGLRTSRPPGEPLACGSRRTISSLAERSPSGLWRRTGNAVRGNPSGVRIPPSPPHSRSSRSLTAVSLRRHRRCRSVTSPSGRTIPGRRGRPRRRLRDPPSGRRLPVRYRVRLRNRRRSSTISTTSTGSVRARSLEALDARRHRPPAEITAIANCHLHLDHCGQNDRFPGVPIYVQPAEWAAAHEPDYTVLARDRLPGRPLEHIAGRPRGRAGHPDPRDAGPLAGPPVARRRHPGRAAAAGRAGGLQPRRVGRHPRRALRLTGARASHATYAASFDRLQALNPKRVLFGHDRRGWPD